MRYRIDPNWRGGFDVFDVHANRNVAWFDELEDAETFLAIKTGAAAVVITDLGLLPDVD